MTPASVDQVRQFFHNHWTVRKFKAQEMPADHLDTILFAAQRAPTDATAQMYSFIHLAEPQLREKIATLSGNPHIATASEAFIVCADLHRLGELLKLEGHRLAKLPEIGGHFAIGDAVMAGQNLLLAAEMLGYRGCWIGGVMNALDEISELIALPKMVFPFAGLVVGVPDENPVHRPRLPREQVIHENRYKTPDRAFLETAAKEMGPITGRGDWVRTLSRYFAEGGSMVEREKSLVDYLRRRFDFDTTAGQPSVARISKLVLQGGTMLTKNLLVILTLGVCSSFAMAADFSLTPDATIPPPPVAAPPTPAPKIAAQNPSRLFLTIHLEQVPSAKALTQILSVLTRSVVMDFPVTCHLESYLDTMHLKGEDLEGTWIVRVRGEEGGDCSAQLHWIDDQLAAAAAIPAIVVEPLPLQ